MSRGQFYLYTVDSHVFSSADSRVPPGAPTRLILSHIRRPVGLHCSLPVSVPTAGTAPRYLITVAA